jgi:hypothetical protein
MLEGWMLIREVQAKRPDLKVGGLWDSTAVYHQLPDPNHSVGNKTLYIISNF